MFGHIQYIKKGQVYRIRNRRTSSYLTSGLEVNCSGLVLGKISQLWLLDEIKPTLYEIVSLQSGEVVTRNVFLNLEKGKWKDSQFWHIQRAEIQKNLSYFWIKASDAENMYLFGSGGSDKVHMKNFDSTLFVSNWEIEEVDIRKDLGGCCSLHSCYSKLAIDVPEASGKQGTVIIQYTFNGRGNQRWIIEKIGENFIIRNLCSSLVLCPQKKPFKSGVKIIQAPFLNSPEQHWVFQPIEQNKCLIRLACEEGIFLGVSSSKQSGYIVLSDEGEKIEWEAEGYIPQIFPQQLK